MQRQLAANITSANEEEFSPASLDEWPTEREKLVCLGVAPVKEIIHEGEDDEYVVLNIDAVMQAIKADVCEEQAEQSNRALRAVVGGEFYGSSHKRKGRQQQAGGSSNRQKATARDDKENTAPNGPIKCGLKRKQNGLVETGLSKVRALIGSRLTGSKRIQEMQRQQGKQ